MADMPQLTVKQVNALLSGLPPDQWAIVEVNGDAPPRVIAILQTKEAALAFAKTFGGVVLPTAPASSAEAC